MRYPEFLKDGGTVGFIAPSYGCNMEPYKSAFANAQKKLRSFGYSLLLGPNCYAGCGIGISNTPKACGEEINEWYSSDKVDVLISCGGGELMCEDLNYVDFDLLRDSKPKWFMGYSDNTNLVFLLTTLCDTAAVYGPCAAAFGMEPWHRSIEDAHRLLRGEKLTETGYDSYETESLKDEEHPLIPYNVTEPRVLKSYNTDENGEIHMSGRLVGGCMDCLVNLLGTKFDRVDEWTERYREDGIIWYLESCDLNVMAIRRAMWQMKNAGWFKYVKGFIIGRPAVHGQVMFGLDQYDAVMGIIGNMNVPVIMDADIGHVAPMIPIICGSIGNVDLKGQDFSLKMVCK